MLQRFKEFTGLLYKGFEENKFLGTAFCDVTMTFDCVFHSNVVKKLKWHGIGEKGVAILVNYLTGRANITCNKEIFSSARIIRYGEP